MEWKSSVICGMAVEMMMRSCSVRGETSSRFIADTHKRNKKHGQVESCHYSNDCARRRVVVLVEVARGRAGFFMLSVDAL